jgi:hypothetical protein
MIPEISLALSCSTAHVSRADIDWLSDAATRGKDPETPLCVMDFGCGFVIMVPAKDYIDETGLSSTPLSPQAIKLITDASRQGIRFLELDADADLLEGYHEFKH